MQHNDEPSAITTNISSFLIFEDIQESKFPKKFMIPAFDAYFGTSD